MPTALCAHEQVRCIEMMAMSRRHRNWAALLALDGRPDRMWIWRAEQVSKGTLPLPTCDARSSLSTARGRRSGSGA